MNFDKKYPLGPHVGDYYNKLFKRALLETKLPLVLFIDGKKLKVRFDSGHCFSVCDKDLEWVSVCKKHPLALCIGTINKKDRKEIIKKIIKLGFETINPFDPTRNYGCEPILASNKKFKECLTFE